MSANVLDYGAIGDGIADDTMAFEAARQALPSNGGEIYAPTGLYSINFEVPDQKKVTIRGDGFGTRIFSHVQDGWAIWFSGGAQRHSVRDVYFLPRDAEPLRNGVAIGNGSGVDFYNCQFHRLKIGMHFYKTSYGFHYGLWLGACDIGMLFSKRGGQVTDPNTTLAWPTDRPRNENVSNKHFYGTQFLSNRIGILFDYEKSDYIEKNVFHGTSFEKHEIAVASISPVPESVGGTRSEDRNEFRVGWFEANANSDTDRSVVGTETVFGHVLPRGDVSLQDGCMVFDNFNVERVDIRNKALLTLESCQLYSGFTADGFVKAALPATLNLRRCQRTWVANYLPTPPSSETAADVIYATSKGNSSGFVRSVLHVARAPMERVLVGRIYDGFALSPETSVSTASPTFRVKDGPFGNCMEVQVGESDGSALTLSWSEPLAYGRHYLFLITLKSDARARLYSSTDTVLRLGNVEIEPGRWHTVGAVTVLLTDAEYGATDRTTMNIKLDDQTAVFRLAAVSIIELGSELAVEELLGALIHPIEMNE